jgi:glycosyltransferase involved in cell wall biosynthesis
MNIAYFGYNSFYKHKRGVENVINFQSNSFNFKHIFYIHWGSNNEVYRYKQFICISLKNNLFWPIKLNLILFRLRSFNVVIHSHNPLYSFFSLQRTDIFTVHDSLAYQAKSSGKTHILLLRLVEKLLYTKCDFVHFISNFSKRQSQFRQKSGKEAVIYNTSSYESELQIVTQDLDPSEAIRVLIIRSIEHRARFDLLLDVAERCSNKNLVFEVAGKGPLLNHYSNESQRRNISNILFHGFVTDDSLIKLLSECNLVLMLAEYGEGFGLPIIEGYLFDKPVIASRCCAIPEVIIDEVFLFDNNVDDIVEKISFAIRQRNNYNFRNYYNMKYSNKIIFQKYFNLYSRIV